MLDKKDKKILIELDKNSRKTDSEIARKVKLSKQVVNYRIQKLLENKVISNFYTILNLGALGFDSYYVFLQFQKLNKEKERKLLNKLNKLDNLGWLISGTGRWDAVALVFAESITVFNTKLTEITKICGEHLYESNFTTLLTSEHLSYKFLNSKETHSIRQTEKRNELKLDNKDKKILSTISQNARTPLTEIASKTKIPVHVANYRLKKLIKNKLIIGFKPKINVSQLDLQYYLLLIQFANVSDERKRLFLNFCKYNKEIYYVTNTVGFYNAMLDIHVSSARDFKEVLLKLKDQFSDVMKMYESITIFDEHKISYLPQNL